MPRASVSAASAASGSRPASALASPPSERPSATNAVWAARAGASAGSGGKKIELTPSAAAPPITPSTMRVGEKPSAAPGSSATSRIAETADSTTSSSPPPIATAAAIASTTITPTCHGPVPISWMIRSATAMPSTTPPTSWNARGARWPWVAPTAITAAIAANAGRGSGSSSSAR